MAGTLVSTAHGLTPIETIKEGDLVYAKDEITGDIALKPVSELIITPNNHSVGKIQLDNQNGDTETIGVTSEHPYYVANIGWVQAQHLEPGMLVESLNGGLLSVSQGWVKTDAETTYNFTVEEYHTYFTGESAAWVHNQDCGKQALLSRLKNGAKKLASLFRSRKVGLAEPSLDDAIQGLRNASGEDERYYARSIANQSTHITKKPSRVVLGQWLPNGGYIHEARTNGGIHYETEPHFFPSLRDGLESHAAESKAWLVNEEFLKTNIQTGVKKLVLFGPSASNVLLDRPNSFTAMEINWLNNHGPQYGYESFMKHSGTGRESSYWKKVR